MAKHTISLAADTAGTYLTTVDRRRDSLSYRATILAYGTWGSGTLTLKLSPDSGTTLVPMKDPSTGTEYTFDANTSVDVDLCGCDKNTDSLKIYVVLSGSSSPALTIDIYDNG